MINGYIVWNLFFLLKFIMKDKAWVFCRAENFEETALFSRKHNILRHNVTIAFARCLVILLLCTQKYTYASIERWVPQQWMQDSVCDCKLIDSISKFIVDLHLLSSKSLSLVPVSIVATNFPEELSE